MKSILIFSDTHGDINRCISIIENTKCVSAVFHAGDCTQDAEDLQAIYPNLPIYYVRGNNDWLSREASMRVVTIDDVKIFLTHGHEQNVKYESNLTTLIKSASVYKPNVIIFGHTHIPRTEYNSGITIINPGSIRFGGTYATLEIENGKFKTKILEY